MPASPANVPRPAVVTPAGTTEVTSAPLGACELAEELPIALGQYREAGAALELGAPGEPPTCDVGKPATTTSKPFRLTAGATLRFWATGGPYPDLSGMFPKVLIQVIRGCPFDPASTVLACGDTVAVDLPEGKYFVTVARVPVGATDTDQPLPGAFSYRVSTAGDTQCPEALAGRRLDIWMGEWPPQIRQPFDLNGDGRQDTAVEHGSRANRAATRVLVADDYPRCLRTVLDADVSVELDATASGGWKNLRTTAWAPSPSGIVEDLWVVRRSTFDAALGRYVDGRRVGCSDGPGPGAKPLRCREP